MKSLASSEMSLNASSSKSYVATVTFAIVSTSEFPMKGDSPDNLEHPIIRGVSKTDHSQDITDDPYWPHVGAKANLIEIDDLWGHELRGAEQHLQLLTGVVPPRQTEVDQLDPVPTLRQAENIFWLK